MSVDYEKAFRDLACSCATQKPERIRVGSMSLLVCLACERFVITERRPDDLAVLRQDLHALKSLALQLQERATEAGRSPWRRPDLRLVTDED